MNDVMQLVKVLTDIIPDLILCVSPYKKETTKSIFYILIVSPGSVPNSAKVTK